MTRHINYYRRIWRISMISLCLWRAKAMLKTPCLLLRDCNVHLVQRESKTCWASDQIMFHGVTSHSKIQLKGCLREAKVCQKCMQSLTTKAPTMEWCHLDIKLRRLIQEMVYIVQSPNQVEICLKINLEAAVRVVVSLTVEGDKDQWQPSRTRTLITCEVRRGQNYSK